MQRTYVMSTDIKSVGYDEETRILEIEFFDASIYQYANVPKIAYTALLTAPYKGRHINANIRNQYPSVKIADGESK